MVMQFHAPICGSYKIRCMSSTRNKPWIINYPQQSAIRVTCTEKRVIATQHLFGRYMSLIGCICNTFFHNVNPFKMASKVEAFATGKWNASID